MTTLTSSILNDADLRRRIGIAFSTRPRVSRQDIAVSVSSGIVTLRGDVPTQYDRHLIVALTRHVAGVFGVDDRLRVADEPGRASEEAPAIAAPQADERRGSWDPPRKLRRRTILRAGFASVSIVALALTGCGGGDASRVPVHPASGAIQFRGQPIVGAFVLLHPKNGPVAGAPSPRGTVGSDGKFTFTTYEADDGAPEGEYVLTVQWYKPVKQGNDVVGGPNVLPNKYAQAKTSDLKIRIAAGENQLPPIQLR